MFDTIHHIAIIGSDYEKSKHFYVDLLGFEIIRVIIPGLSEPPVRTLRATIPENGSHIFR